MITACNCMIRTYDYLVDEEDTGKFSAFFERSCDELGMGQVSILILLNSVNSLIICLHIKKNSVYLPQNLVLIPLFLGR